MLVSVTFWLSSEEFDELEKNMAIAIHNGIQGIMKKIISLKKENKVEKLQSLNLK